jgi:hypothetical protein
MLSEFERDSQLSPQKKVVNIHLSTSKKDAKMYAFHASIPVALHEPDHQIAMLPHVACSNNKDAPGTGFFLVLHVNRAGQQQ